MWWQVEVVVAEVVSAGEVEVMWEERWWQGRRGRRWLCEDLFFKLLYIAFF
ncbi:hypothetical protein HanRHA438_Chr09g0405521 [Helianthus annuus]|nr:hypothetical protein HanIR_Chr09g0424471 [Helianthus annuus]KAJ0888749.1 hypothetical protein HanRHA438_Chr09g0405521 [Helianthus annuus]